MLPVPPLVACAGFHPVLRRARIGLGLKLAPQAPIDDSESDEGVLVELARGKPVN